MDTRDLGSDFFCFLPEGKNPHGSNENSNTIYRRDLTYSSDAGAAFQTLRDRSQSAHNIFDSNV